MYFLYGNDRALDLSLNSLSSTIPTALRTLTNLLYVAVRLRMMPTTVCLPLMLGACSLLIPGVCLQVAATAIEFPLRWYSGCPDGTVVIDVSVGSVVVFPVAALLYHLLTHCPPVYCPLACQCCPPLACVRPPRNSASYNCSKTG